MPEILTTPLPAAVAWKGADMARTDDWIYRFSDRALNEIDRAVSKIKAKGISLEQVSKEDFHVPSLAEDLIEIAHELEHGRGFVQLRGLRAGSHDQQSAEMIFWGLGLHLGTPLYQNRKRELLGRVRDEGLDVKGGNVRLYQTNARQEFHTDIAGDVIGLMCLQPAKSGGQSRIASAMAIYNELLAAHPWYVGVLYNNFNVDARGEQPDGEPPAYREPVYAFFENRLSCRFKSRFIRTAQAKTGVQLARVEEEAISLVERLAEELCFENDFEPGDIQLLNNHVILHGRTAFEDHAEPNRRRHLLRLWLSTPGARKLPPALRRESTRILG